MTHPALRLLPILAACALLALISSFAPTARAAAAQPSHAHRLRKGIADECAFKLDDISFDLCPIFEGSDGAWGLSRSRRTTPTVTKTEYTINLRRPLEKVDGTPGHEQCPPGTWICQIISNTRPRHEGEEPRLLQVVPVAGAMNLPNATRYRPGVNVTVQTAPSRTNAAETVLHARLHGGFYMGQQQNADFQFLCDRDADEPSSPEHLWTWNGTHTFQWRTKHACATMLAQPPSPSDDSPEDSEPAPPEDSAPPPPPPPPPPADTTPELVQDGAPLDPHAARRTAFLLLTGAAALALVAYLARAHARRAFARIVKAHPRLARFRVGERVLVRWAYEDLELEDGYGEGYGGGEEDTMVNFSPMAEEGAGEGAGEGIPLKPSPRRGRWGSSYGAA